MYVTHCMQAYNKQCAPCAVYRAGSVAGCRCASVPGCLLAVLMKRCNLRTREPQFSEEPPESSQHGCLRRMPQAASVAPLVTPSPCGQLLTHPHAHTRWKPRRVMPREVEPATLLL